MHEDTSNSDLIDLYNRHIQKLLEETSISKEDIFQLFEGVPLREEILRLYELFLGEMQKNIGLDLEPTFFFINSDHRFNAYAKIEEKRNIICINVGIIHFIHKGFRSNKNLEDVLKTKFPEFPMTFGPLMYEAAIRFTFFHELGHLVQESRFVQEPLTEEVEQTFSYHRHVLEIDADEFSSITIAGYIADYTINQLKEEPKRDYIINILTVVCTDILLYILSFCPAKNEIYYEEKTHPHPIIRLVNIIYVILSHYLGNLTLYGISLDVIEEDIVHRTINLSKQINDLFFKDDRINSMQEAIASNHDEIFEYWTFLKDLKRGDKNMATHKWNLYVKSQNRP